MADGATLPIKYIDAWVALAADAGLDQAFKDQFAHLPEAKQLALQRELLRRWREAKGRMEQVAAHLVDHFIANVQAKGLKAMLVCDGRDMAVGYKDLLDALMRQRMAQGLPTFESRVVVSLAGMTAVRTGLSVQEEAAQYKVDIKKVITIEERVAASVQDYVVVHELCHTLEKSHTKVFWALVAQHMPDWRRQHAALEAAAFGDAV